ncbi:glycosyltransferase [Naasia aerilata]|uniref:Glycosyltransferase n=1 Tax=Naasia aerilata TaxID=1162966 RepID=A0ABN6XR44_9MICO|nr:glycosyltransferase [Naasia aerilata]BDZ45893.1 hypothetical protein GCM10025866_18020 [Naasia aerilata]
MPLPQSPDLTVVVTAHREGRLLRPTLRSIRAALAALSGDTVELLLVCDNADARTLAEAQRWRDLPDLPFPVRIHEVHLGESGASRNAGAREATGEFVAFVDGDDLVSANYFSEALRLLRAADTPTIVHPEYILNFGARSLLWRAESTRRHDISYRDLMRHNLWPSSAVTRRSVYLEHPYRSLPPEAGYGPEDWIWNIDTSAAGITHDLAPDTVFFYRVRETGGVNNRHSVSILPEFDLEGLRRNLPIVSADEAPAGKRTTQELAAKVYSTALPVARAATSWLSHDVKRVMYQSARWTLRAVTGRRNASRASLSVKGALMAAAEIEPAISWTAYDFEKLPAWRARDDGYAEVIEDALAAIGERHGALVAVPWVGVGGADLVSINYARALQSTELFGGRTTMLGTYLEEKTLPEMVPDGVAYAHLDERWLAFPPHVRKRLLAQIIVLARPKLIVSVNSFHFTEALQAHAAQILDGTDAYSTLFAFDRIGDGYPTNPITDDSQRAYLDHLNGLITDNTTTAALIEDILALPPGRILVHRQPAATKAPLDDASSAAFNDERFTDGTPFRLLWPHRLDDEKRPDALVAIADELRRRGVPAVIEVWGQRVLSSKGSALMRDLEKAGVVYRGPYSGGLSSIDLARYHALLLTSKSEGLPLVLVQALQLGLPVIASAVGGVPDIIHDGETGLLTAGPDDAPGFADAIQRMMGDRGLRRSVIERGRAYAEAQHSWSAFQATIGRDLISPAMLAAAPAAGRSPQPSRR